jgi:uncharacterized protein
VTPRERWWAIAAGAGAGFAGGMFGVGGGVVMVPLLSGPLKLTQHQAHGTSLAVIGIASLVSAAVYAFYGNVAWVVAVVVGIASALAARWGARLAARFSNRGLARVFAVFLFVVALRLLWAPPHAGVTHPVHGVAQIAMEVVLGLGVGILAGFMGVGGGILAVPAFTILLGMPQQLAQGTSLAVILGAAPAGAREHARRGNVILTFVPWLALGAIVGGPVASVFVQRVTQTTLVRAFAIFLIVNAVIGWVRSGAPRKP